MRQTRFTSTSEATTSLAQTVLPLAGQDFTSWHQAMAATVLRWRRGAPDLGHRSPAVSQEVTRCALAVTEVAMGYAELAWWCDSHDAAVAVPTF